MSQNNLLNPATVAAQSGINTSADHQSVVTPLYLSTNYRFDSIQSKPEFDYGRGSNPNRNVLADTLATLEQGRAAIVTSSGMAAINLVLHLLSADDVLVAPIDCYGGTFRLFDSLARKGQFKLHWLDFYAEDIERQIEKLKPSLIWTETPSNPLLRLVDVTAFAKLAKRLGARLVTDNTFCSPLGQQPLLLGADIVVHSTTKYINGHGDVIGGAVICKSKQDGENLLWWANNLGLTGAPFDSYLTLRGLRTLSVRIKQHEENALAIADILQAHTLVSKVHYPGLKTHPDHLLAARQQRSFGGMLSFEFAGTEQQLDVFLSNLSLFTLAESLGGTESLICHPATMTHAAMPESAQKAAGITSKLLRLSVGIEDKQDLIADLLNAFTIAHSAQGQAEHNHSLSEILEKDDATVVSRLSPALAALW